MSTYSVWFYDNIRGRFGATGTNIVTIPHTDIISIEIDPNQGGNDNPFEINGRTAKVTIINKPEYAWIFNLPIEAIKLFNYDQHAEPQFCRDFFSNLVWIMEDGNNTKTTFQGLIKRDSLNYDLSEDTITFTIYDYLWLYIYLAKLTSFNTSTPIQVINNDNSFCGHVTLYNPFRYIAGGDGTEQLEPFQFYDGTDNLIKSLIVHNKILAIPEGLKHPKDWTVDDILLTDDNHDDYVRCARYAWIYPQPNNNQRLAVAFMTLYRSIGRVSGGYRWRIRHLKFYFDKRNVIQPIGYWEEKHAFTCSAGGALVSQLTIWSIPPTSDYTNEDVTGYYGDDFSQTMTVNIPIFHNCTEAIIDDDLDNYQFLRVATPADEGLTGANQAGGSPLYINYGIVRGDFNIAPPELLVNGAPAFDAVAQGVCTIYGLTMAANNNFSGGITIYPNLIHCYGQIEGKSAEFDDLTMDYYKYNPISWDDDYDAVYELGTVSKDQPSDIIAIDDNDIVDIEATGTLFDLESQLAALDIFENGTNFKQVTSFYKDFYEEFMSHLFVTYRITLPKEAYIGLPFQPYLALQIMNKTLYLNKWSEPLYRDLIELEAVGGW